MSIKEIERGVSEQEDKDVPQFCDMLLKYMRKHTEVANYIFDQLDLDLRAFISEKGNYNTNIVDTAAELGGVKQNVGLLYAIVDYTIKDEAKRYLIYGDAMIDVIAILLEIRNKSKKMVTLMDMYYDISYLRSRLAVKIDNIVRRINHDQDSLDSENEMYTNEQKGKKEVPQFCDMLLEYIGDRSYVAEYILDSIRAELRQTIINNKWDESHRVDIAIALGEVNQNIESLKEALNQITDKTEQNHIYGEALIDTIVTLLVILTKYRGNMFKTSRKLSQLRDRLSERTQHVISVIGKQASQTQVGGEKATNATS